MAIALGVGCGARGFVVEEHLIDDDVGVAGGGAGGGGPVSGLGGSVSRPDEPQMLNFEITNLPRCELGFPWADRGARDCNFRFNNRCYNDETAVCACACPRESNNVCVLRGFLSDPDNPLMVSCQPSR